MVYVLADFFIGCKEDMDSIVFYFWVLGKKVDGVYNFGYVGFVICF